MEKKIKKKTSLKRQKRALVKFVGTVLSQLFGTASEADLGKLKSSIMSLKNSQSQLVHVVSESVTLLNKTNENVKENREATGKLINVSNVFHSQLSICMMKLLRL